MVFALSELSLSSTNQARREEGELRLSLVFPSRARRDDLMNLHDKPLTALTAEDLMSREVITVPTGMSLRGAALLLTRAHVSGAPVVDERGRCVGVLSTSDFLKLAGGIAPQCQQPHSCVCSEWQV